MALIRKANPVGADFFIDQLQQQVFDSLGKVWKNINHESYPRCYRNKKEDGYVAEMYLANNEYNGDSWWDDTKDCVSFFGLGERITTGILNEVPVHLVFFLNLKKVKPLLTSRGDEEVRQDISNAVGKNSFGFASQSIELFVDNVLKEYPGSRKNNLMSRADYHPLYCVRFNFLLTYNGNTIC